MITNRLITEDDKQLLSDVLTTDEYHQGTLPSFFYEPETMCLVYEDEKGPICFVRGKPIVHERIGMIQLDIQYLNNRDAKRNLKAMIIGFPELERRAKENGFAGFFFVSTAPLLKKFCVERLRFKEVNEELLVKLLPIDKTAKD
jgi:hypothetical protein